MNVSCADLIPFRAEQKQYVAHEKTPEHPADPFDILGPRRGDRKGQPNGNRAAM